MPSLIPDIALIHDHTVKGDDVAAPLAKCFTLKSQTLHDCVAGSALKAKLYVFFTNPSIATTYEVLKAAVEGCDGGKLFVLPTHNNDSIKRLHAMGIGNYVILPIEPHVLRELAKVALNEQVEQAWSSLDPVKSKALTTSIKCFEKCFQQLKQGQPLPMKDISDSCQHIREAAAMGGLNQWIDALDRHHNYTFRHSMFICGSLTYFAHAIGIGGADLEMLTIGGLLHDIGKSDVPTEILDKPGKLNDREWDIMKKHPEYSREILLGEQNLDKTIISMAVAHHEKLDGTGYPEGLSGSRIDDFVRMTAIADVYSALIDKRGYKGAMTSSQALDIMEKSDGHFDLDLLRTFKSFVLEENDPLPDILEENVA